MGLPTVLPLVALSIGLVLQICLGGNPFVNIPAVEAMCLGQHLADLPIIQASTNPCSSCTDR